MVVEELGAIAQVALVGGAARDRHPFGRALERQTGLPVVRGPVEATALGNALVQGVAIGRYADLAEARAAATGHARDSTTSP
jgi:rhamnulokinase